MEHKYKYKQHKNNGNRIFCLGSLLYNANFNSHKGLLVIALLKFISENQEQNVFSFLEHNVYVNFKPSYHVVFLLSRITCFYG